jgi:molecular chaperone DnaJ
MEITFTTSEVLTKAEKTVLFVRYVNCKDCDGHGYIRKIENICNVCNGVGHSLIDTNTPFGNIKTEKECGACDGAGYTKMDECEICHTKGKVTEKVKLTFPIPDGVTEGYRLRFRDKGDRGLNGGKNGDLFLVFRQDKKDEYRIRRGFDLEMRIDIPFDIALIGGAILIPLPNGKKVKMPVKKGTQNSNLLYVQGGGLYNPNKQEYGDLTAIANIEVPTVVSDEDAEEILRRLNKGSVAVNER